MNINVNSSSYALSFLQETVLPSLTQQQKRILLVASAALACLTALFLIRCYCFKTQVQSNTDDDDSQNQKMKSPVAKQHNKEEMDTQKSSDPAHEEETTSLQPEEPSTIEPDAIDLQKTEKRTDADGNVEEGIFLNGRLINGKRTTAKGEISEGKFDGFGLLNGQGKITLTDGMVVEGEFQKGRLNGNGKITWKDGKVTEGTFKNGELNGQGKITYIDGEVIEGEFKDHLLHKGKITHSNKVIEEGEFIKHGVLHGKGKRTFLNGKIEEGKFNDGKIQEGKITHPQGKIEEGEFKNEELSKGVKIQPLADSSAERYIGDFEGGKLKLGKKWSCGAIVDGKFDDSGTTLEEGEFENNQLNGKGTKTYPNGQTHEGSFKNGKLHGQGKLNYGLGDIYEGTFVDGCWHGQGTFIRADGTKEEGEFQDDFFVKGKKTYPDGSVRDVGI